MAIVFANTHTSLSGRKIILFSFINHSFLDNAGQIVPDQSLSSSFDWLGGKYSSNFILKCLKFS
jgi:hypothetical protein